MTLTRLLKEQEAKITDIGERAGFSRSDNGYVVEPGEFRLWVGPKAEEGWRVHSPSRLEVLDREGAATHI